MSVIVVVVVLVAMLWVEIEGSDLRTCPVDVTNCVWIKERSLRERKITETTTCVRVTLRDRIQFTCSLYRVHRRRVEIKESLFFKVTVTLLSSSFPSVTVEGRLSGFLKLHRQTPFMR